MNLLDFILNVAALLLWLNWRGVAPLTTALPGANHAPLPRRPAPPPARWMFLAGLLALLALRAVFYWQAGPSLEWNPGISLGLIHLYLRSDILGRMLLYSVLSFGMTLGVFYLFLLMLSSLPTTGAETDPAQRLVQLHLGPPGRWPAAVKLFLPLLAMMALWCLLNPLLLRINLVPEVSRWRLLGQAAVIGLAAYFTLKFLVAAFLLLHLLNSYVYLGDFTFWNFVNNTARTLLRPLRPLTFLRVGRVDLAPVAGMALVALATELGQRGLERLYH